jgi:RNA polymerase sigma factor (sigma-70 family)
MDTNEASRRVAAMVVRHGELLHRTALSLSLCADDAQDAVQRAFEIYLKKLDSVIPETELNWLKVVVRHEALAVRRGRAAVATDDLDFDARPSEAPTIEDHLSSCERVERTAEALAELHEDEARALVSKAAGLSYEEIAAAYSWTYNRTDKAITRGRARFLAAFRAIESGERCSSFASSIAELASGEATSAQMVGLRPHLRHCSTCRATVRELHQAPRAPRVAAALLLPAKWFAAAKAEAYAATARVTEAFGGAPWTGGRTAAGAALLGLCVGGGSWCAVTADPHDPPRVVAQKAVTAPSRPIEHRSDRVPRLPLRPTAMPTARDRVSPRTRVQGGARTPDLRAAAKSEEFVVQPAGHPTASVAVFEASRPTKAPEIGNAANLEFSVAG